MVRTSSRVVSVILAATALTGCAATPEVSRSATSVQVPQAGSLSSLSRQFQRETPEVIHFAFDSDTLDAKARAALDEQAAWIIAHPTVTFRVYGHTDRVGSTDYNADLGLRRATRAVAYLVSKGIAEERLEALVSFGEDVPVVDTEARELMNRRVVTEVFGFIAPPQVVASSENDPVRNLVRVIIEDDFQEPEPETETETGTETGTGGDTEGSGKNPNSGRGNGDEAGDPGKSGGKNNGGDEI